MVTSVRTEMCVQICRAALFRLPHTGCYPTGMSVTWRCVHTMEYCSAAKGLGPETCSSVGASEPFTPVEGARRRLLSSQLPSVTWLPLWPSPVFRAGRPFPLGSDSAFGFLGHGVLRRLVAVPGAVGGGMPSESVEGRGAGSGPAPVP